MPLIRIASRKDVADKKSLCVEADGKKLALFNLDGTLYVMDNACPHKGGPMCEGETSHGVVVCPWHGSEFGIADGSLKRGPATTNIATYPVSVSGDDIFVDLPGTTSPSAPRPVAFNVTPSFDAERPFGHGPFLNEIIEGMKFPFKLYGILPIVVISQNADEIDVYLGEIHVTEMDLKRLSALMDKMNDAWKTRITYCLFHAEQFPGAMLLNIRGPKAPTDVSKDIRF
jgi:nitrite reductase/ring-hydroxylating ferredoxin subunit